MSKKAVQPAWQARIARIARRLGGARRAARPLVGQFQTYSHTLLDRYPWLFRIAAAHLDGKVGVRLLSFGCSTGEEVFSLRQYFPQATIRGIDVHPGNIAICQAQADGLTRLSFHAAATTEAEDSSSYDAIFCLAVLCLGDLTTSGTTRCDPRLTFDDFERVVTDFTRCLKPSGLLLLHTTNFRFCDTRVAAHFETLLEARQDQMALDVQFGRDNRRLSGPRYRGVVFRKRT